MAKKITVKAETRLEGHVKSWINRTAADYDSGAEGVLGDLFPGGCSSGYVGHLKPLYTAACCKFYRRYLKDIAAMLATAVSDCGCRPDELFGNPGCLQWDKDDPLVMGDNNQNLLAWFGFEEAARALAQRQGIEV